ncbi:sugar ABC transporter permease [Clostridiales bacterium NSJ-32]|uniref:Sugar ABC transporter permease n=2 Tax=Bianquea renquensis TaxID=2763661 RepID=A0A926I372_9FIRM|nr:ABC transporter permease subunit [Bianquea renquensis]MBC8544836.1 sugar ABC transporter permease [Bianquea renquensis]
MVLPALVWLLLFAYKPMYGLIIAFKDFSFRAGIWGSKWVGVQHFQRLFSSYWFPIILKNTLTLSLLSLVFGFPMPILFALMVNEIRNKKVQSLIQTVSYAPHFISTIVVCGLLLLILSPEGIINLFLNFLGKDSVYFIQEPDMFKWIYVISGIWQQTGWDAIIYFAALSGVDKSLVEAAEIDGASRFQKMVHVYFPALVPTIVILLILRCGSIMSVGYEKVYALQNSVNLIRSEVISTYVYKIGLTNQDFSFASAVGLLNSVVNTVLLVVVNSFAKKVNHSGLF